MSEVASSELNNHIRALLDRVAKGERISITVQGQPVAELAPIVGGHQWMPREKFFREVLAHRADSGLTDDLAALVDPVA